ncbi:hypothetical protein C9I92_00455 [Photobacterium ganghwense]|uniref:Uncharacterized protein n=1 Tax=Photobacterium ganghwense TaxID=320778 RepID=A0A0J1H531_9GAMM|nr:hypothetical protein ABT57_17965 [Photobacterium ganghwense]PSU10641.1 hypothetical protein C9I92_00455 [Photobacterium ganghwense]
MPNDILKHRRQSQRGRRHGMVGKKNQNQIQEFRAQSVSRTATMTRTLPKTAAEVLASAVWKCEVINSLILLNQPLKIIMTIINRSRDAFR